MRNLRMWIICCCSIGLVPGTLLERTGSPGIEAPIVGLGRAVLNSGPALNIEAEFVGSNLFTFEFGKPQSPDWCWFITTFLLGALTVMKNRKYNNFQLQYITCLDFICFKGGWVCFTNKDTCQQQSNSLNSYKRISSLLCQVLKHQTIVLIYFKILMTAIMTLSCLLYIQNVCYI